MKNLMRPLTARLEDGYCSITVVNHRLITVIRLVLHTCIRLFVKFFLQKQPNTAKVHARSIHPDHFSGDFRPWQPQWLHAGLLLLASGWPLPHAAALAVGPDDAYPSATSDGETRLTPSLSVRSLL